MLRDTIRPYSSGVQRCFENAGRTPPHSPPKPRKLPLGLPPAPGGSFQNLEFRRTPPHSPPKPQAGSDTPPRTPPRSGGESPENSKSMKIWGVTFFQKCPRGPKKLLFAPVARFPPLEIIPTAGTLGFLDAISNDFALQKRRRRKFCF